MTDQLQRTRPGTLPGQRQAGPATSATSPAPAPAEPARGWEAHSWTTVLRVAAARALLGALVGLLVWSLLPLAVGWVPRVILSGSMEPRIHSGDVVVTREVTPAQLAEGQVLTTEDPDKPGRTRTHRMEGWDEEGRVVTRGDANAEADSTPVAPSAVLGVGVVRVPFVGLPQYWIAERRTGALGLALAALSGLVLAAWTPRTPGPVGGSTGGSGEGGSNRGGGVGHEGESQRSGRRRGRRPGRTTGTVVTSATVLGAVAATLLAGHGSYAAFADRTTSPASSFRAAATFHSYADVVLGDGPTFLWRTDEQSGDVLADATGRGNGAFTWNARWGQAGALVSQTPNRALGIDGAYVEQSQRYSLTSAWSAELWVQTTRTTGGALMTFLNNSTGQPDRALYLGTDGRVRFGTGGTTALLTGTSAINDGNWHHVVLTSAASGSNAGRLYVDGVRQAQGATVATAASGNWRVAHAPWNGQVAGNPDQYFRGNLDEIAVYPRVLTPAEISEHRTAAGY